MKKVLVLDFGGQYNLLVARRVRECGVYCEIKSFRMTMDEVRAFAPDAIIFTGGPATVFDPGAPMIDPEMLSMGVPVLGICYGLQLMMHLLGGQCCKADTREYGKTELTHTASPLFDGVPETAVYWMSHGVEVERLAPGFEIIASTEGCRHAAVQYLEKKLYGVQFHPEVVHTEYGRQILENFLYKICGFRPEWTMASYLEEAVAQCREKIGNGRVLLALSGGVDSSVAAALLQRAVGRQLTCIFVDHGLLRKDEGDQVEHVMTKQFNVDVRRVNAGPRFLSKLAGVTDPERKRKIIGEEFIRVFEEEAKKIGAVDFLAQGTIYPDVVESALGGESTVIKVCLTAWISRTSWSLCAACSRMRCGSWAWSWACRSSWCGVSPSRVPAWPSASSARSPRKSCPSFGMPTPFSGRRWRWPVWTAPPASISPC